MIESLDSHLTQQQKHERHADGLIATRADMLEARQLFAKSSSTASLDNLDTASLYGGSDSSHAISLSNSNSRQRITHHKELDQHGSYKEHHQGPKPEDNYDLQYNHKSDSTLVTRILPNGDKVQTLHKGKDINAPADATRVVHKNGDWEETSGDSQLTSAKYIASEKKRIANYKDGTVVNTFYEGKDEAHSHVDHTETIRKEGNETIRTIRTPDSNYSTETKNEKGIVTSHAERTFFNNGGYSETGGYIKDGESHSYLENFDAKTGTTTRTDHAQGSDGTTTTTTTKDGTVTVESPDGTKKTTRRDGSETVEKDGTKISEKPAYDYKTNAELNKSREELNQSVGEHIPPNRQAQFKKDMAAFEERAAKNHLSPDEITKSYQQMSKMLNAPEAVVSGANRALLAESLIHQCADPRDTQQGKHNTCNVTSVAEITLARNPSKAVEMASTTAIEGKWTAPDGKVIKIDSKSLEPGSEEQTFPPTHAHERTFTTQVLNLVMINDAMQRREKPLTYVQGAPDDKSKESGDTGERLIDANGKIVKDAKGKPVSGPDITDGEIARESKRMNGSESHYITVDEGQGSTDSVSNENQLRHRLVQFYQQGQFPVTLAVDGDHWPIAGIEHPDFAGHVVTIDGYDPKTGKVHITNQWGKRSNRWTSIAELWVNASGETSSSKDGAELEW